MVYNALDCPEDDYYALFVLCLLYAMSHNKGKCCYVELTARPGLEETVNFNRVIFWFMGLFIAVL